MKLANALIERADLQRRIEQVRQRLNNNLKVQEGDKPAEDPTALLAALDGMVTALQTLIQRINRTNANTPFGNGTIADAIAERDMLQKRQHIYREAAKEAVVTANRYSRSEIRIQATMDSAALQQRADEIAKAHRELDARLQEANWTVELL